MRAGGSSNTLQHQTSHNDMSTFTTSDKSENAPSKATGQFHSAKGTAVEAVGNLTGAESWQQSGKQEHTVSTTRTLTTVSLIVKYRPVKPKSRLARRAGMQRAPPTVFRARRIQSSALSQEIASKRHLGTFTSQT